MDPVVGWQRGNRTESVGPRGVNDDRIGLLLDEPDRPLSLVLDDLLQRSEQLVGWGVLADDPVARQRQPQQVREALVLVAAQADDVFEDRRKFQKSVGRDFLAVLQAVVPLELIESILDGPIALAGEVRLNAGQILGPLGYERRRKALEILAVFELIGRVESRPPQGGGCQGRRGVRLGRGRRRSFQRLDCVFAHDVRLVGHAIVDPGARREHRSQSLFEIPIIDGNLGEMALQRWRL